MRSAGGQKRTMVRICRGNAERNRSPAEPVDEDALAD
jgi:hypothetical protein